MIVPPSRAGAEPGRIPAWPALACCRRHRRKHEIAARWLTIPEAGERAPRFAAGEQVADRYLIRGLLGRGGMGEVYEAWDEELEIPVALKTLRLPAGSEDEALRRLKREGLLARSVSHPNVCRVYDLGRHGKGEGAVWFLTMEVLRGETLADRLRGQKTLPRERVLPLAEQMAAGLGAAHQAGVIHRDFKPSNVVLVRGDAGEQAVVTDFGIARAAGAAEKEAHIPGTPAYMAPEQVRGEEVGPAADIYALGVVLYEMVTGRLPFTGGTAIEVARRRLLEEVLPPSSIVPELDERWEAVILRCLEREPRRRFARAEEVAAALAGRARAAEAGVGALDVAPRARHTLPAERDGFVGREAEIERLARTLFAGGTRLLTLVGAGGMGKTRLAIRYGWQSLEDWSGGVSFCDLTEARSLDGIASAVAGSLGVPLGREDPIEQLGHAIAGRGRCLVILDNFEQVADHAAATVGRWMARAGEARFVVTSRERLSLGDEGEVQAVEPLSPEQGLELFTARARWLRPGLELVGTEAESAREVVRLVEGMPLAIELAAARMRVMTASQIAAQMGKRFHLLTGGPGNRHETLAAVIEGSWELLRPWEKAAWAQCAVFEDGFTLEAAEVVVDLSAWSQAPSAVEVVHSLVDKSLLRRWVPESASGAHAPEPRFGMYVSLQEYAREKLDQECAAPEGATGTAAGRAVEERHGTWYARYGAKEALEALDGPGGTQRRQALQSELENLMVACRRAVARGDGKRAVAAYRAAWEVLDLQGPFRTAVEIGEELLAGVEVCDGRAFALETLGNAEWRSGRVEKAKEHLEAALAIHRQMQDRRSESAVLGSLAVLHLRQGRMEEAHASCEEALAIHRELGDRRSEGIVLGIVGSLRTQQGRMHEGRAHYEAALTIDREVGNRHYEGTHLASLGLLHLRQGRKDEACANFETALSIHRELGDRRSEGIALLYLGMLHSDQGKIDEARAHYEAALALHRHLGDRAHEGATLGNLGILHIRQGRLEEARFHYEEALAIHREIGDRMMEANVLGNLGILNREQGQLEEALACYEAALGIHRELGDRRFEGIVLGDLGSLHAEEGRAEEARAHLEAALTIQREVGDRCYEGIVLGSLASLELRQGRMEEAQDAIRRAEGILRKVEEPIELGRVMCLRAELERQGGDMIAARATLAEVDALAAQADRDAELERELTKLRQALAQGR